MFPQNQNQNNFFQHQQEQRFYQPQNQQQQYDYYEETNLKTGRLFLIFSV